MPDRIGSPSQFRSFIGERLAGSSAVSRPLFISQLALNQPPLPHSGARQPVIHDLGLWSASGSGSLGMQFQCLPEGSGERRCSLPRASFFVDRRPN